MGAANRSMSTCPWGVDSSSFQRSARPTPHTDAARRRGGGSVASSMMQKKKAPAQTKYQPKTGLAFLGQGQPAANPSPRWNPASGTAGMIARKVIDRQKAGELTARSTSDPQWERKKNDLFAYADNLDGAEESKADVSRKVGAALRVDTGKQAARSTRDNGPSSPAQRIRASRGPRADLAEHNSFETKRVEDLWTFSGAFVQSQFEGEKPGYMYKCSGRRGPGYYRDEGDDSGQPLYSPAQASPLSPAQRITADQASRPQARPAAQGWAASRDAQAPSGYKPPASRRPRPVSAHPSSAARVTFNGANTARDAQRNPDVPGLNIQGGSASARPQGLNSLGLKGTKPRPASAAISREQNRAGPVAGAWRASQSRAGGTTKLW